MHKTHMLQPALCGMASDGKASCCLCQLLLWQQLFSVCAQYNRVCRSAAWLCSQQPQVHLRSLIQTSAQNTHRPYNTHVNMHPLTLLALYTAPLPPPSPPRFLQW